MSILGILTIFTLPGMNTAITQAVAKGHDKVLIKGTKEKFKWSFFGSIAILGVGVYYFLTGSILLGKCLMISSLFFPFLRNFQTYSAFLSGKKQFEKVAEYQVIVQIISTLITILVIYFSRNLMLILIANLFSFSLLRCYFFKLTLKSMTNQSNDKETISFGKHLTVQNILGMITAWGDKIIIGTLLSFPELAVYSIAKSFSTFVRSLMAPIVGLSLPKLSKMEEKEAYLAVKKKFLHLVLLTVVVCGSAIAICPYILTFLYSQKYVDSVLYAQLLLVALILGIPISIFNKALFPSQREIGKLYKIRIFHPAIMIMLFIILTPIYGLLGAVLARLIANLFGVIYSMRLAKWI
jgi:O-antigen/teichoic acid export membrane protein